MASKYYAVKKGLTPGIYRSWDECKAQVDGYSCASYKSFKTIEEAETFMGISELQSKKNENENETESCGVMAYVDGSYNVTTGEFSYGMIILRDGEEYTYSKKYTDSDLASMRNVAGEIKGAEAAMRYAVDNGLSQITIYHDYEGIAKWCTGEWKAGKPGTIAYRDFFNEVVKNLSIKFVKVAGHSNNKYNDIADKLAKEALGI